MASKAAYVQAIENAVGDRKKLIRRLNSHGHEVNWNEHQTRYALIDPILRALGWNLEDPRQVKIDSHTSGDKPDYLLFDERVSNPQVVVEAKRVTRGDIDATIEYDGYERPDWTKWSPKTIEQLERYWNNFQPRYAVLTSGIFWAIYDLPNSRVNFEKRQINYSNILSQRYNDYMDALTVIHRRKILRSFK